MNCILLSFDSTQDPALSFSTRFKKKVPKVRLVWLANGGPGAAAGGGCMCVAAAVG